MTRSTVGHAASPPARMKSTTPGGIHAATAVANDGRAHERAYHSATAGRAGADTSAASLMFAVAPECQRLTGLDPTSPHVVEAHAEMLVRLLVP